jgi:hypothetical protein
MAIGLGNTKYLNKGTKTTRAFTHKTRSRGGMVTILAASDAWFCDRNVKVFVKLKGLPTEDSRTDIVWNQDRESLSNTININN